MKHHLLQYDPASRLWSRPDILPGHVFGQPEHALAFGHTDSRTPNPESGICYHVTIDEDGLSATIGHANSSTFARVSGRDPEHTIIRATQILLDDTQP
jgi:hypothetical protein